MLNIYKKREADKLVVTLEGRLDSNTAPKFEEELLPSLGGVRELKLDFSFLDYLSSAGLRVLLMAYKRVHRQGGSMKLTHVNDTIRSILKAVNFRELLTIEGESAPVSKKALPGMPSDAAIVTRVFKAKLKGNLMDMLILSLGTLVDAVFIGNFLGVDAMAAYGMIWPLTLAFGLIGDVLLSGSLNLFTNLVGHGKMAEGNRVFSLACVLSAVMALALTLLVRAFHTPLAILLGASGSKASLRPLISQYLTALVLGLPFISAGTVISGYLGMESDEKRSDLATVAMTVVNIVGDAVAIFAFHGGMFALGLTTSIAEAVYFCVLATHFTRKDRILRFSFKGLRGELDRFSSILLSGAPIGTSRVAGAIGGITINHILAAVAANSHIAAYSVHKSMGSFVSLTYLGIADAVWLLSSLYYGEEDRKALNQLQKTALQVGTVITGLAAVVLLLFPRLFASIYIQGVNVEALALSTEAVRLFALSVPLYMVAYLFENYLIGVHRFKAAIVYGLFLECGAFLPAVWATTRLMGGRGAWFATPIALALMILGAIAYIVRWKYGGDFQEKRLVLEADFGTGAGGELNISATTLMEVVGMSQFTCLFCEENGVDRKKANALSHCIEELGTNIIQHGFVDGKPHSIDIRILVKNDELILRIRDDCPAFNLLERYELMQQQPEDDPTKNLGLRIVMKSCKDIQYLSTMGTNNLIIRI